MYNFKLEPIVFNYLGTICDIIKIDFSNYHIHKNLIQECIDSFNDEIDWEDMFNLNKAILRLSNGMVLYVCIDGNNPLGYVWFKGQDNNRNLFNLFFRNKNVVKKCTGKEFVSDVINRFEYNKIIYCTVDDWNEKSIKLFKRLGFQKL
jgi:hypothetical protein